MPVTATSEWREVLWRKLSCEESPTLWLDPAFPGPDSQATPTVPSETCSTTVNYVTVAT